MLQIQKEHKKRRDWIRKLIDWELLKKRKFYHFTKWYMHKPEAVFDAWNSQGLRNTNRSYRRPDLVVINKTTCHIVNFVVLLDNSERRRESEPIPGACQRIEKKKRLWTHEGDSDVIFSCVLWNSPPRTVKEIRWTGDYIIFCCFLFVLLFFFIQWHINLHGLFNAKTIFVKQ